MSELTVPIRVTNLKQMLDDLAELREQNANLQQIYNFHQQRIERLERVRTAAATLEFAIREQEEAKQKGRGLVCAYEKHGIALKQLKDALEGAREALNVVGS